MWNHPITRLIIPDFVSVGVSGTAVAGIGSFTSFQFEWALRGNEMSTLPVLTMTQGIGGGMDISANLNMNIGWYLGNPNLITRGMFIQNTISGDLPTIWGSTEFINGAYSPLTRGSGIMEFGINAGLGLPGGTSGGVSNTYLLHDFNK